MHCLQRRYVPLQWASSLDDMLALTADRVLPEERVHLVGYSMGGYIATHFARQNPERVASLTLIGYDPAGLSDEEIARRKQLQAFLKKGQFRPDSQLFLERFVHPDQMNNPDVAGIVTDMADDLGATTLLAHTQATTPRKSMTDFLQTRTFNLHIIGADADRIAPPDAITKAIELLRPESSAILPSSAHMMMLEKPEDVAALLTAWLTPLDN